MNSKLKLISNTENLSLDKLSDDDLFLLVRAGQKSAFEELVKRYQRIIVGFTTRYLNDSNLGKDVAQDVFLSLWAERERNIQSGRFVAYLIAVARNRCRYIARQRKSHFKKLSAFKQDETTHVGEVELPMARMIEREKEMLVKKMLGQLPDKPRTVMILRYTSDMSLDEISDVLEMPLGTVKSHLSRGVKRLHHIWKKEAL